MQLRDLKYEKDTNPLETSRFLYKCFENNLFIETHNIYNNYGNKQLCIYDMTRDINKYKPSRRYKFGKVFRNFHLRGVKYECGINSVCRPLLKWTLNFTIKSSNIDYFERYSDRSKIRTIRDVSFDADEW